jgi:hypothetical protein
MATGQLRPTVLILSYERPIYLWATLDSLYRATRSDADFIIVDSASQDPLVHKVIDGFDRRGMFSEILKLTSNDTTWADPFFSGRREALGEIFYYVDGDVVVEDSGDCWIRKFEKVVQGNPRLAMLGSKIDRADFEDPAAIERRLGRTLSKDERQQIKFSSPERTMPDIGPTEVSSPFNPPGRLMALRTAPVYDLLGTVMRHTDGKMHEILRANGWETGIYGGVVHRHLSLCNFFDYPEYSMAGRQKYYEPLRSQT